MGEEPQTQGGVQVLAEDRPDRGYDPEDEYRPEPPAEPQPPPWMDGTYRIGIHTSIAGHVKEALEKAHALGANALQIFSASPRMWQAGHPSAQGAAPESRARFQEAEAAEFQARREHLKLGPLAIHANYLINLASRDRVLRVRSIQAFHDELARAVALGADYLVVHPGSAKGVPVREALDSVAQAIRQGVRGVRLGHLRILLENTAGQGTALGATFSELKVILEACGNLPMGVCVDTAHLLAAGFDISSAEGLEKTLKAMEATVGLASVYLLHVNDSKAPLGSRVDRHQHIGKGHIGLEAFRRILTHPLLAPPSPDQPQPGLMTRGFILETPIDRPGDDARNVAALWRIVGRSIAMRSGVRNGFSVRKKPSASAMKTGSPKRKTGSRRSAARRKRR